MRTMLRWTVPVGRGNAAIEDGSMRQVLDSLIERLEPEAAYFFAEDGRRSGMVVFDLADPAEIPQIAEPLFQTFDASVEFLPVMNLDDLRRALEKVSAHAAASR